MSISFSGLASGLDTSSWVESLTALKRAKIETYQAEKEKVVLSQQTLLNIKNFFNSFRSVIEKVTDTRFYNGGSADLFAQNLAISSKANILTATANSEAQEGVYSINVNNLATNTQASSGYAYTTTQTVSATATLGSTLTSLGVKAGNIGVTVNGIERRVKIGNDETIQSFIEKLNNIGAKASYNEGTGIFNVNLGTNDIRDIDNTGIVNALRLKGVNEGYTSNTLQKPLIETITEKVNLNTKLYEVGIQSDKIQIASNTNSTPMTLSIESTWTFESFIQRLGQYGFEAELTEDGCFTLKDAVILDPGETQILKAFGWDNPDVSSSTQTSNKLQYTSTVVEGTIADRNTLLKDLADINNGDTIVVKNSSNRTSTITLSQTSTIGDVLDKLSNAGLYANINSSGVVSISDGSIVGGTFDIASAFNLTEQINGSSATSNAIYIKKTIAQDVTSTANVTYTGVRDIQLTDKIGDICQDIVDESVILVSNVDRPQLVMNIAESDTFQNLFDNLKRMGVEAKLENGVISLTASEGYYVTGLEPLGIGVNSNISSSTITVAITRTSGTLYYTQVTPATWSDSITDYFDMDEEYLTAIFTQIRTDLVTGTTGLSPLSSTSTSNISSVNTPSAARTTEQTTIIRDTTLIDCTISETPTTIIQDTTFIDTPTIPGSILPSFTISNDKTIVPSLYTTVLALTGTIIDAAGNKHEIIISNGECPDGSFAPNNPHNLGNGTFQDLKDMLAEYGITMTLNNGVVSLTSSNGAYVEGTMFERMGIQTLAQGKITRTTGNAMTSTAMITYTGTGALDITSKCLRPTNIDWTAGTISSITEDTRLSELNSSFIEGNIVLYNKFEDSSKDTTLNFTKNSTIGDIQEALLQYGLRLSITDPDVSDGTAVLIGSKCLTITKARVIGSYDEGYHIVDMYGDLDKVLGFEGKIGSGLSYDRNQTYQLHKKDTFAALGIINTKSIVVVQNGTTSRITVKADNTVEDLINMLAEKGIKASTTPNDALVAPRGEFYIYESDTSYIKSMDSELMSALKLSGSTYSTKTDTNYINSSTNKTIGTSSTATVSAGTTMGELGKTGVITVKYNNSTYYITASADKTVSAVLDELHSYNISASLSLLTGKITIGKALEPNTYVTDFGGVFGITGSGYTSSIQTSGTTSNTSSNRIQIEETLNANWDTTLGQINPNFNNGNFRIVDSNKNLVTVNIDKTDSLRDVREKLAMYNIAMDCSNGIITFSGINGAYIKSGNLGDIFKLGDTVPYKTIFTGITTEELNTDLTELYLSTPSTNYLESFDVQSIRGTVHVYQNGVRHSISMIDGYNDLGGFINQLAKYGITATIGNDSKLHLTASGDTYITTEGVQNPSDFISLLGINETEWKYNTTYQSSSPINITNSSSQLTAAQRDTLLADLGVTTGEYLLYKDGVRHTLYISSDDTLGDFLSSIRSFGIESSLVTDGNTTTIKTNANGNTYITASNASDKSNVIEKLFGGTNVAQSYNYSATPQIERYITTLVNVDEDTKLADISTAFVKPGDSVEVTVNNDVYNIKIGNDDTIGTLLDKFNSIGINASLADGKVVLQSGYNSLNINVTDANGRAVNSTNYFTYSSDLGGYSATDPNTPITSTEVIIETHNNSVANYADYNTKLSLLNISDGKLTLYRNGEKAEIEVNSEQTFGDLRSKIAAKFSDVNLTFDNGSLKIASSKGNVVVGTTTDTSNFAAITGMSTNSAGESVSSRALYRVNNNSKIMDSGLFVRGNVTAGTFKVGDATVTIDNNTTLDDIISQINYSDDSQATAFWDSIDGKFVIKSKKAGASLINIEAGTSNFTDIMGLTSTENGAKVLNTEAQELGKNAVFTINGTRFTSTSNTVDSSVSRIQGVTINLKDVSNGETVTLTIEKDKETVATAVSDIVDAYNELIENIDKEVARGANLSNESTLKLIRNQIRSLMTSSISNSGSFKNLASIGISLSAAASGNIRTDNINTLSFNKDKFLESFQADFSSVKSLLVGTENNLGILSQVEEVLEQALGGVTGYFASAEKSYSKKISNLDDKIDKANKAADRYKVRLEAKFKAMDMLISKFQNQYSSFLG